MKLSTFFGIALCIISCKNNSPSFVTGLEGKSLPPLKILLPDSSTNLDFASIKTAEPFIIFYYSPRCPFCQAEMDGIVRNISLLRRVKIYAVTSWPFSDMASFYNHFNLSKYSNIIVGRDYSNAFNSQYKLPGFPCTAFYDKEKKLKVAYLGLIDAQQIKTIYDE